MPTLSAKVNWLTESHCRGAEGGATSVVEVLVERPAGRAWSP